VVRDGVEPPTFRFSEGLSLPERMRLSPLPVSLPGERLIVANKVMVAAVPPRAG
jgi:hypothetical protein